MTAANQQIITSFEELGLSPEEIAEELDIDLTAVKATLMQFSRLFRVASTNKPEELGFTEEQEQASLDVISNIARGYTDADQRTQFRAAAFVRNDRRGRLDVGKQLAGLNINVITFNEQMKKAIRAKERSKQQIIDIPAEVPEEISMGK